MQIYINNRLIETEGNYTILQLCSKLGIEIPRFCYHAKLSIAANCRMCLIQVEDSIKPVASCSMGLNNNMKIFTNSMLVKKIRESILEFLLINHPLDCPICDQGGECDLQDQTLIFGSDRGRFYEKKRAVSNFFAGPLIKTFMTRCIHCTRCIRFSSEITDENFFGALGRGSSMKISNFLKLNFNSPLSGNVIDICPVGALNSKPYSFVARSWELNNILSIDILDSFFSKIRIDYRGNEVMRITPGYQDSYKGDWISNKTRFSFDGLKYQRLTNLSEIKLKKLIWFEVLNFFSFIYIRFVTIDYKPTVFFQEVEGFSFKTFLFWQKINNIFYFARHKKKTIIFFQKSYLVDEPVYWNKLVRDYNNLLFSIGSNPVPGGNLFSNFFGILKILTCLKSKISVNSNFKQISSNFLEKKIIFFF